MKLLLCTKCSDVFSLRHEQKTCSCGKTKGRYIDDTNAVYSGEYAVGLGFKNDSFVYAIFNRPIKGLGKTFESWVMPLDCLSFTRE